MSLWLRPFVALLLVAWQPQSFSSVGQGAEKAEGNAEGNGAFEHAERLLLNGRFHTVANAQPRAEAVAIRGGRFVYVGDQEGGRAFIGPATVVSDLQGKLVIPGLVDSHAHPSTMGLLNQVRLLPPAATVEQLMAAIAEAVRATPGSAPVVLCCAFPLGMDKALLDAIEPDRPVMVYHYAGHAVWLNSSALRLIGIGPETPDPVPGLSFYLRSAQGALTGWAVELAAFAPAFHKLMPPNEAYPREMLDFLNYLVSKGVTTLFEAGTVGYEDSVHQVFAAWDRQGLLPLRIEGSYHVYDTDQVAGAIDELKRLRAAYDGDRLRYNTIKIHYDGVYEVETARHLRPYHAPRQGAADGRGAVLMSMEQLRDFIVKLHEEGINLHLHNMGEGAVRISLDAVEAAQKRIGGALNSRIAICHLQTVADSDIPRFKQLGVIANFTPQWHGFWGPESVEDAKRQFGDAKLEQMFPAQSFWQAGATVTFSSDTVVTFDRARANPFLGMQVGHNRQDLPSDGSGKDVYMLPPASERLSLEDLIKGYTLNGAHQLRLEDRLGSIEVGKQADLVVLDRDIFAADRYRIHEIQPQAVFMDGKLISGALP